MKIISIPTEKFRTQNPIFHEFYSNLREKGFDASDFSVKRLLSRDLKIFQVHFPEHFATNFSFIPALGRCAGFIVSLIICKYRRIPIVWTVHNITAFEMRNAPLYKLVMGVVSRTVDGCIFLSRSSEKEFRRRFPLSRPRETALIRHPSYPIIPDMKVPESSIVLGMIGEQKAYKQPLAALSLYEAARKVIDCRLLIAGKVHCPEALRLALSRTSGPMPEWLDRRLEDPELERAAKRVDFILLPYSIITNSGAAVYALSCGRAIITSRLPLFLELRDFFGSAWVRIADGTERNASFWEAPTEEDFQLLKKKLEEINLDVTATKTRALFGSLLSS